jgi:hypothetical protein
MRRRVPEASTGTAAQRSTAFASWSSGTPRDHRKPCARRQPIDSRAAICGRVSTPSAIVVASTACPSVTTLAQIARSSLLLATPAMKARSIFRTLIG